MQELRINNSTGFFFLFLAVLSIAAFFGFVLLAEGKNWSLEIAILLGVVATVMTAIFILQAARKNPGLIIGPQGIDDRRGGLGLIPWSDIHEVAIVLLNYPALGIKFKNPEKYGLDESGLKKAMRQFTSNGFTTIDLGELKTESDEIITAAQHFLAESRK